MTWTALPVTSGAYLVWFRADLPRATAQAYWRGPHGQIANRITAMEEYLQHHFALSDHGFWPAPTGVASAIPPDWRLDGLTEVRLRSLWAGVGAKLFHMNAIKQDEQNLFDRVLANMTNTGGGCWWTGPYQRGIGFRAVLLLRARHEVRGRPFRRFVEQTLAPALMAAGAHELRSHVFQPGSRLLHWTPAVRHDDPVNRRYAAALIIGAADRYDFERLVASPAVKETQPAQLRHCVAIHAYAVERTYPLVLNGQPQAAHWD